MSKEYRMVLDISLDELIELKKKGVSVRKVRFGITPDEYGKIYSDGKYTMRVKASQKEIEAALKRVK